MALLACANATVGTVPSTPLMYTAWPLVIAEPLSFFALNLIAPLMSEYREIKRVFSSPIVLVASASGMMSPDVVIVPTLIALVVVLPLVVTSSSVKAGSVLSILSNIAEVSGELAS